MDKQNRILAEELTRAHASLLAAVRNLETSLQPTVKTSLAELRAELIATQKQILDHFRYEEQNGYLDAVRQREPRLEHNIEALEEEHRQLADTLAHLREKVYATTSLEPGLRAEILDWIGALRHHEARENLLVQDAFNFEASAED